MPYYNTRICQKLHTLKNLIKAYGKRLQQLLIPSRINEQFYCVPQQLFYYTSFVEKTSFQLCVISVDY